ncbi:hypothetical protein INP83_13015 [Mucilaginibacter sp. 21P]|uniref:hypothetical protein n=1 Tax=Mucilaginibacter sp. 21P TaxID=2778902 RepID=UPI001C56AEE1|nr:hypothetical protein [Mucilaginibacter sp. 21P]QXV64017.1 hypothetical protein INP83_13015 [Mucilaginibacter sp. 21P]
MLKEIIDRFSRWYNSLGGDRPVYYFFAFCFLFLMLLWLGIHYVKFESYDNQNVLPANIGKPSGLPPTEPSTPKKH